MSDIVWKLLAKAYKKKTIERAKKIVEILNDKDIVIEAKTAENMAKKLAKEMAEKWKWEIVICGELKDAIPQLDGSMRIIFNNHKIKTKVPDTMKIILTGLNKYNGIYVVYGIRNKETSLNFFLPLSFDDIVRIIPDEIKKIGAMLKVAEMLETYAYRHQNKEFMKKAQLIREHAKWELEKEVHLIRKGNLTPSVTGAYLMGVMDYIIEMTPPDDEDAREIVKFIQKVLKSEGIPQTVLDTVREEYRKMWGGE